MKFTIADSQWKCCSFPNICHEMGGHCETDKDCYGSMVCGLQNCDWDLEQKGFNCCVNP